MVDERRRIEEVPRAQPHARGGTESVEELHRRFVESSDVYFDALDNDGDGSYDDLRIVINSNTSVTVIGHFAPRGSLGQRNGRMEQIIFSDEVVTSAASMM